ncbi:serine/arginine repetitive matrix protein 2 isoform X1 [Anopheles aquasalis]|uniref:serine/arginine repetitive matrix protein 2 isoform X1 n=1 Tax=Anopheles aquasalis TaxID=42839 RepID=UPI00215B4DDA|nr:serine/arginine repetitive matrix protein 2 isoform X1 [Anopheles aquasalis]
MAASFWRKQQETADQDANDLRECSRIPESLATTLQQQQQHQRSPAESYRKANQNEEENGGDEERPRQNRLTSARNPAILDALDSLHRSLLFSNLKFDTAEQQKTLDAGCLSQDIEQEQPVAGQLDIVHPSWPLEPTAIAKVNIAQGTIATASHRSTDAPETKGSEWSGYRISNSGDTDDNIVDCEQESLSDGGPDPNNNTSGNRVKMMVQKYDKGKVGARAVVCASDHHPDAHCIVKVNPGDRLRSSVGFEGETSDFESASVTSGSSMAADDVGRRSVRTSSAFSEGSRDVASIDRFDMGMVEQAGIDARNVPAAVAAAGHSTKITININCRCDTDPRRTSKATAGGVEEANKENVHMNRCSGAHHAQPPKLSRTEFEKAQSSNQQHKSNERKQALTKASPTYPQDGVEDETENEELMVLENEGVDSSEGGFDVMDQEEPNDEALHIDHHRYSAGSGRHCRSPEDEEYLDCDELRNDSTLSFYEEATSHPVTPQDLAKQSSTTESHKEPKDDDKPMISIVQELTEDQREVMSTITLNKAQIKAMQEYNDKLATTKPKPDEEEKPEKRRKSHEGNKKRHGKVNFNRQQRIMDDNFCNEVLDSAIHFDRLYGLNHATQKASAMEGDSESLPASSPTGDPAREECFSDPGLCGGGLTSPGEESFDSSVSLGKLEGKARYSGRTVGRLMLTRLKKLHQQATGSGKQGRVNNVVESEASTSSSLLHTSGPKKPPRTFADSPKRSSTCARKEEPRAPNVVPSCPRREDLDGSDPSNGQIGWKVEQQAAHSRPKSHQVGWTVPAVTEAKNQSIPEQVYSMLHYSEDESRKQLIRKGNSKAVPQQKSTSTGGAKEIRTLANAAESKLGPRLYIDTVDGVGNAGHDEPKTPPHRRHSSSTDFERFARESNVKSTPHRREHRGGMQTSISSATTRRILEEFLNEERAAQHPAAVAHRGKLNVGERRRRTTGGIFERRRLQQENFLDDARRTNHEPRRKMRKSAPAAPVSSNRRTDEVVDGPILQRASSRSSVATAGKIAKRRTFRKAVPLLKHTRSIFEASKKKILAIKKFETPKKSNNALPVDEWDGPSMPPDPNINRHSSVKKKHALHHKHLGYTPDNLRCKSCCQSAQTEQLLDEERIAPSKRISNVHSVAPGPRRSRGNVDKENRFPANGSANGSDNRKSARSLNFASAPPPTRQREQQQQQQQQQRRRTASPDERSDEAEPSPSPPKVTKSLTDRKFMKSLRNLKISPRKFFRFASSADAAVSRQCTAGNSNEATTSHGLGEFHSFDDLNLDNVAHMGDFLNNIRQIVERPAAIGVERGSPGSHLASAIEGEPIYQEISPKKGNKMVLNEFISSETNKRYLMVNNDPNILYATVSKPTARGRATLPRSRSFTDVTVTGVSDPVETSTPVRKPLNNICKSQVKPTNRQRASFSPRTAIQHSSPQRSQDSSSRDSETSENDEEEDMENDASCLYRTAVTGSSYRSCGNDRRRRSTSSTSHTTRRSLFSPDKSFRSPRQETDDDHDISVLQQEQDRGAPVQQKKQLEEQVQESLIVRERAEERYSAIRLEHERFQKHPSDRLNRNGSSGMRRLSPRADSEQSFAFEKDIIVEVDYMGNTMCSDGGEGSSGGRKTTRKMAPIISFDTDGEIESLHRYQDQEISELVSSLHNNVTLSDIGTLETGSSVAAEEESVGYDTVDFVVPSCSHQQQQQQQQQQHMSARLEGTGISVEIPKNDPRNLTVNTEDASKLISQVDNDSTYYTSNASPPMLGSPSSGKHSSSSASSGAAVMRNLKEKLRASFRKSKSFIKTERQRIAALIREERTGDNKYVSSSTCSSSSTSPRRQPQHSSRARDEADTDDTYRSLDPNDSQARNIAGSVTELTNRYMSKLMAQIQQQRDAQKQLKQAVAICRTTREFECSTELIEAERLLLLATLKETAARNVLNNIDYTANGMTLADRKRIGRVALNHFEFPLKRTALADTLFNYFYIVVCSYKNEVKATPAKERRTDGHVCFRDCEIEFLDLDADYEIRVEVFVLRLRKNVKNISFENRYHPDKDSKYAATCPSPSKLRRAGKMLSFRSSSPKNFDLDNELSRFKSQGYLTLTSSTLAAANVVDVAAEEETRTPSPLGQTIDGTYLTAVTNHTAETTTSSGLLGCEETTNNPYYSVSSNFQRMVRRQGNHNVFLVEDFKYLAFDSMAYSSNMTGTIGMSISSEVRFESSDVSGFLDVGSKVNERISWNRRWCKMNGFTMEFWNYPQECHEKQPILYIDLVRCVNERIELADRSICSRTRTMKIDISTSKAAGSGMSCSSSGIGSYRSTGGTSTTSPSSDRSNLTYHLLAADSQTELNRWMNELNRVVKFLKEWKI